MLGDKSSKYYKYPRTLHLPWSPGVHSDDKVLTNTFSFHGKLVVITEKMDGENTTLYRDHLHARSIDSKYHASRDWIKGFHSHICHLIPKEWRLCGENLYARHSIAYDDLKSYFYLFSIWDEENKCLSWEQTLEWAAVIGLSTPTVLYEGLWDEALFRKIDIDLDKIEGYIIRTQDGFPFEDFSKYCAKWVRSNHVQTDKHWMHQAIILNKLKRESN